MTYSVHFCIRLSARQRLELHWEKICDKCATDADTPWIDPKPTQALLGLYYRVTAYNADGKPSALSAER